VHYYIKCCLIAFEYVAPDFRLDHRFNQQQSNWK